MSAPEPLLDRANGRDPDARGSGRVTRRALARLVRAITDPRDGRPLDDKRADAGLSAEQFARLRATTSFQDALRREADEVLALEEFTAWRAVVRHLDEGDLRAADLFFKLHGARKAGADDDGPWVRVLRECIERIAANEAPEI